MALHAPLHRQQVTVVEIDLRDGARVGVHRVAAALERDPELPRGAKRDAKDRAVVGFASEEGLIVRVPAHGLAAVTVKVHIRAIRPRTLAQAREELAEHVACEIPHHLDEIVRRAILRLGEEPIVGDVGRTCTSIVGNSRFSIRAVAVRTRVGGLLLVFKHAAALHACVAAVHVLARAAPAQVPASAASHRRASGVFELCPWRRGQQPFEKLPGELGSECPRPQEGKAAPILVDH
mmetsp:Transcript_50024/g.140233  ORF Transcript_50024/g.140233 Transcript_50024/m.140233 type:complete len:235 (-) Transcript_50024:262-966(-)